MMFNNLRRQLKAEIRRQRRVLASKQSIIHGEIKFAWFPTPMTDGTYVWLGKFREHPAGYFINGRGTIDRMPTPFMGVVEAYSVYRTPNIGSVTFDDLEKVCDHRVPRGDIVRTINAIMTSVQKNIDSIQDMEDHLNRLNTTN